MLRMHRAIPALIHMSPWLGVKLRKHTTFLHDKSDEEEFQLVTPPPFVNNVQISSFGFQPSELNDTFNSLLPTKKKFLSATYDDLLFATYTKTHVETACSVLQIPTLPLTGLHRD
jgi:hypothetical protein